jgi:hypothetical protein
MIQLVPLARDQCRVSLTYGGAKIIAIEPGPAFDHQESDRICAEIEGPIMNGPPMVGREISFNTKGVNGWWRGERSKVQVLSAPVGASKRAPRQRKAQTIPSFSNFRSKMRGSGPSAIIPSPINAADESIRNSRPCSLLLAGAPSSYLSAADISGPMFTSAASRSLSGRRNGTTQTSGRSWPKNFRCQSVETREI